jgi:hypothetical protein
MNAYSPLNFLFSYGGSDASADSAESMTVPSYGMESYRGQIFVFTTPLLGNLWGSAQYSPPQPARRGRRADSSGI